MKLLKEHLSVIEGLELNIDEQILLSKHLLFELASDIEKLDDIKYVNRLCVDNINTSFERLKLPYKATLINAVSYYDLDNYKITVTHK